MRQGEASETQGTGPLLGEATLLSPQAGLSTPLGPPTAARVLASIYSGWVPLALGGVFQAWLVFAPPAPRILADMKSVQPFPCQEGRGQ